MGRGRYWASHFISEYLIPNCGIEHVKGEEYLKHRKNTLSTGQ